MFRTPVICAVLSLALVVPVSAQRLGQPFPSRPRATGPGLVAFPSMRLRPFFPTPYRLGGRIRPGGSTYLRARPLPIGHVRRHLLRPARGGVVLIVPSPFYAPGSGYPVAVASEEQPYGTEDAYESAEPRDEDSLAPGPATGAYIAVDGEGAASVPPSDAGCAEVTVLLAGSGSYAAAVLLPSLGASTPSELQDVLRDAHRHGRFVRLRGPGGLGMMIPAGPGIRDIEVRGCR